MKKYFSKKDILKIKEYMKNISQKEDTLLEEEKEIKEMTIIDTKILKEPYTI